MEKNKKIKIFKIIILILVIAIIAVATVYMFPLLKKLNTTEGQTAFKEKTADSKIQGFLILFGLEVAQIVLAFLPGEPIELLAGICFGSFWGTVFIMISVFISTALIYFLVKKHGKKFISEFVPEKQIEKIENSKLFNDSKKIEMVMVLLFLIPGTPKDLFVYIGALLQIKTERFLLISTLLRFPSVISSTIAGDSLLEGNWIVSIFSYVITFAITIIIVLIVNMFDKNKVTGEVIKSMREKEI